MITLRPEDLIHSSLPAFSDLIKDLTKERQDICREIRKKGRNKIHALKCRKKSRDEVSRLQVSQRGITFRFQNSNSMRCSGAGGKGKGEKKTTIGRQQEVST